MCTDCGCDNGAKPTTLDMQTGQPVFFQSDPHGHADGTRHSHAQLGGPPHSHVPLAPARNYPRALPAEPSHAAPATVHATLEIETRILAKNDALATRNRSWLAERNILALNLMSAPGAGKTTLLERTIRDMRGGKSLFVLEGDQATANDGERIRAVGAAVVQINTGTGCHLDADMVARGMEALNPNRDAIVVIENVGNLVCPALFDLGEHRKIVVFSTTEGEDKPLKYPHMFRAADLVLLNKIDLLPYVDFDVDRATTHVLAVNPNVAVLQVSARSGDGLQAWYDWLNRQSAALHQSASA